MIVARASRRALATLLCGVLSTFAACGDDDATRTTGPSASAELPSDELPSAADAVSDAEDVPEASDAGPEPPDGGETDVDTGGEVTKPVPDEIVDDDLDPCTLVTAEEWAGWLDDTEPDGAPVHLEYGEACGFLAEGDEIRLAIALIDLGNGSWLDDVDTETVDVDGHDARWAEAHPIDASSTLTVDTPAGEIIIEMSGGDRERQLDGAIHFATLALDRVPS
jgi:hypothetical protein